MFFPLVATYSTLGSNIRFTQQSNKECSALIQPDDNADRRRQRDTEGYHAHTEYSYITAGMTITEWKGHSTKTVAERLEQNKAVSGNRADMCVSDHWLQIWLYLNIRLCTKVDTLINIYLIMSDFSIKIHESISGKSMKVLKNAENLTMLLKVGKKSPWSKSAQNLNWFIPASHHILPPSFGVI